MSELEGNNSVCRILVVGASRQRVQRVVSMVRVDHHESHNVVVECIPCVATFDACETESKAERIRYLTNLQAFDETDYPRTLLPLFDAEDDQDSMFPPIAGVAIGCGIEGAEDTERIQTFLNSMTRHIETPICA